MDAVLASTIDILEDVVKLPDWQNELALTEPRFIDTITGLQSIDGSWRLKERVKTVSVALVLCLNVGVDPPDIVKIEPAAHLECWFDPLSEDPQKSIETISNQLERQYEQWHSRARYKKCLDPTVEEVKRLCTSLRRYSKEDRVLFHYNGHGVPRPTQNGEIWVFNEKYTQYIPLAIYDLQQWMGAPSIYVFDCSCAGSIVDSFLEFAKQHRRDYEVELAQYNASQQRQILLDSSSLSPTASGLISGATNNGSQTEKNGKSDNSNQQPEENFNSSTNTISGGGSNLSRTNDIKNNQTGATNNPTNMNGVRQPPIKPPDYENCFHLAACEAHQILPMQPDLPADLFTSCLTTPIKMALRWFIQKNDSGLIPKVTLELVDKIPGTLSDRRTMLGELNWIFTAITDTIAWDVLPRDLFQRLYRQDLLVASLFRNFLLADRIMRTYDCTPVSHPKLPKTYHHPMWRAWDMVVDLCLSQLIDVLEERSPFRTSSFFAEQLTAFEVWLEMDHSSSNNNQQPDHQLLPIILQVLLSPVHRLRALDLLSRFLNLGPGAVNSALSVGIFPYVLKLLQSNAREVRPFLLSIWAKILSIDRRCQVDLVRDHYHRYFLTILTDSSYDAHYRTMAAFVLTCIVRDYPPGQEVSYQANLIAFCLEQLDDPDAMLRKWLAICLGCSWDNYDDARWCGVRSCAHEKLYLLLDDHDPEVRAASVYALGTFINSSSERTDHANTIDHSIGMKLVSTSLYDSSVLVRHELVVALQYLVLAFESQFIKLNQATKEDERKQTEGHNDSSQTYHGTNLIPTNNIPRVSSLSAIPLMFGSSSKIVSNVYHVIWKAMYTLAADPQPRVAAAAQVVIDEIRSRSYPGMSSESLKESKSNSSISESSSPNTATFSISESPPSSSTSAAAPYVRKNFASELSSTATTALTAVTNAFSSSPNRIAAAAATATAATAAAAATGSTNNATTAINANNQTLAVAQEAIHQQRAQQTTGNNNLNAGNAKTTASNQQQQQQRQQTNQHDDNHLNHPGANPTAINNTITTTPTNNNNLTGINSNNINTSGNINHKTINTAGGNNNHHQQQQQQQQVHVPLNNNNNNINNQQSSTSGGTASHGGHDRSMTKSASVSIQGGHHHRSLKQRYGTSTTREHNVINEDDNRSNMSSQRPLVTTEFVDWCTKYFIDPENNFTSTRSTMATSKEDQQREWRMLRVLSYRNVCLKDLMVMDPGRFNEQVSNYKVLQVPNLLLIHPYDPIMIVAGKDEFSIMHLDGPHVNNYDNHDNIHHHGHYHHQFHHGLTSSISKTSIVAAANNSSSLIGLSSGGSGNSSSVNSNLIGAGSGGGSINNISSNHHNDSHHHHHYHLNDLIGTQSNCQSSSSQITSLQLINPQYNSLICLGSSEGSVKIWRAYNGIDYSFKPQLVTAFHLMPELQPSRQGLGMILLWHQNQSRFYATSDQNDVRIIKVWDAASESKVQDIPTCAEFGVSCLSSDGEHSIAAGFLDGSIRIYDTRLKKTDCRTFTFRKHSERILSLHMFKPGEKHINLVSGDTGGEVRFWDKRAPTSVKRVDVGQKMSVMSVHPNADVFACGLRSGQGIKLYNLDGTSRAGCVIKCQDSNFFTSRHNPSVSSLAFHPLKPSLVAGYSDAVISIYSSRS